MRTQAGSGFDGGRPAWARLITAAALVSATVVGGCGVGETAGRSGPPDASPLLSHVGDFPLGAATTRFDYQSIDAEARRLYIAKMGAGELLVFDLDTNKLLATLRGFPKATGVLAVPDLHKLYVSVPGAGLVASMWVALGMAGLSSGRGEVAMLDTRTLQEIGRVPGGVFPDGIAYDPNDHRIFVSDELGSSVIVIDATTNRALAPIELAGEVGNVRYDAATSKIYAPIQSRNQLAVVEPTTLRLIAHPVLRGADHPHGLAVAPDAAIGYVACDGNDRLLTVDLPTGNVLSNLPVAHDPDVLAIDARLKRLYVASESGVLSVFDIAVPRSPSLVGNVFLGEDAHSVAVDGVSGRLYVPLADQRGSAVLRVLAAKDERDRRQ